MLMVSRLASSSVSQSYIDALKPWRQFFRKVHFMKQTRSYKNLKKLHNADTHNCFACSPSNPSGLHMKFYTDEQRVYSWVTIPDHMGGWNNIAHGGILSAILDEIMGWAGMYLLEQLTLTKSMTIDFVKAAIVGEKLRVEGWVQERIGKREAILNATIYNTGNEICAESEGIFTLVSLSLAKRIGIIQDEFEKTFFEPLIRSKAK